MATDDRGMVDQELPEGFTHRIRDEHRHDAWCYEELQELMWAVADRLLTDSRNDGVTRAQQDVLRVASARLRQAANIYSVD